MFSNAAKHNLFSLLVAASVEIKQFFFKYFIEPSAKFERRLENERS